MTQTTDTLAVSRPKRRLRDLGVRHWLLLAETAATLAAASLAIRMLPFRRVVKLAARRPLGPQQSASPPKDPGELAWAVEAIAWRMPWRTVCFQKGLTLHLLSRRRGVASVLHYGVGKGDEDELKAHVWISVDGRIVQGGAVADRFSCLATYPDG